MKIAICFWGLTRSLKYTIDSIKKNIFDVLTEKNIDYDKFLHTYYFDGEFNNRYTNEKSVSLDFEEYKLLEADYVKIENQDEVKKTIDFSKYDYNGKVHNNRTMRNNAVLGLNSMKEVTKMVEETEIKYDYIMFIRPDCKFLKKFNTRWFILSHGKKVLTPSFGKSGGYNDRMFIGNYNQGIIFGKSLDYLEEYTGLKVYIAEKFTKWLIHVKMFPNGRSFVRYIDFNFQRIRANGEVAKLDRRLK